MQTQFIYGNVGGVTDIYPTETKVAVNYPALTRNSRAEYDLSTGLVTRAIDVDNNVASSTVYDALGRPTLACAADNVASVKTCTSTEYNDVLRRVIARSDLERKDDGTLTKSISIQHYDRLGRVRLARTLEDPAQDATNEQHGIKVQTRYRFGTQADGTPSGYSHQVSSNPYRAGVASQAGSEATMGWTLAGSQYGGVVSEVESYAGSTLPAPWGANSNSTGKVVTTRNGITTTVADQDGKQRSSTSDALGRLASVTEAPGVTDYGLVTNYSYDALDNLRTVTQGQQTRTFTYDSLKRLASAAQPESGTQEYTYDPNGNVLTKRDARGVVTRYEYDPLNRLTLRRYTGNSPNDAVPAPAVATPSVTYTYDTVAPYGKGRLASVVTAGVSTTNYTGYDALGKVTAHSQVTDNQTYTTSYSYNLAGALKSQTYPSGRTVTSAYDAVGRMSEVKGQASGGAPKIYASGFDYTAHGGVRAMQMGNGLWESAAFNTRLQMTQIGLGTSAVDTSKWKLTNDYGTTNNNGNVRGQTLIAPGLALTESYTYDPLNRLEHASETNASNVQQWQQGFEYDRYGNRQINLATTSAAMVGENPTVSPTNNRIVGGNYAYDAAGNMTRDKNNTPITYDGENLQRVYGDAGYAYDGEGKRIKNTWDGKTTVFVYDAMGKLVAEYTNAAPQPQGGGETSYLTQDHLGSTRVVTNSAGAVTARLDYAPFGEKLAANVGGRSEGQGYVDASVRQKFTGHERDDETGLDYMKARYYSSQAGRFTSPDPMPIKKRHLLDPRDLNRYAYVANNPLAYVDPDGKDKIRVTVTIFIPARDVTYAGRTFRGDLDDRGNRRTEGVQPSYRVRHTFVVETDPRKNMGNPLQSSQPQAGVTRELSGPNGRVIGEGQASTSSMRGAATQDRNQQQTVNLTASGNPSDPLAAGAPGVTYNFNLTVQSYGSTGAYTVGVSGEHDRYPSFTIDTTNLDDPDSPDPTTVYEFDPRDEGYGPTSMFPAAPNEVVTSRETTIQPRRRRGGGSWDD